MREDVHRLFFALWPSDSLRAQMQEQARPFADASRGRLIPPANFHVTVLFLGDVPRARVEAVREAAAKAGASVAAFELTLDQLESWRGSGVLCLTATLIPPELIALNEQLRFSLLDPQSDPREQEFRPHVTLVRNLRRPGRPVTMSALRWPVGDFVLVDSRTGSAGSTYTVIDRWPLAGQPQ